MEDLMNLFSWEPKSKGAVGSFREERLPTRTPREHNAILGSGRPEIGTHTTGTHMPVRYKCTSKAYCPGQTARGLCHVKGHFERKKCPFLKVVTEKIKVQGVSASGKRMRSVDMDLPWWIPLEEMQRLQTMNLKRQLEERHT